MDVTDGLGLDQTLHEILSPQEYQTRIQQVSWPAFLFFPHTLVVCVKSRCPWQQYHKLLMCFLNRQWEGETINMSLPRVWTKRLHTALCLWKVHQLHFCTCISPTLWLHLTTGLPVCLLCPLIFKTPYKLTTYIKCKLFRRRKMKSYYCRILPFP